MKVFCTNGIAQAGKDTFVNLLAEHTNLVVSRHSTVDPVSDLYKDMGWDGAKDSKSRTALNTLKNVWVDLNDGPTNHVLKLLAGDSARGVDAAFVMVREFDEMMKLVAKCQERFGHCSCPSVS